MVNAAVKLGRQIAEKPKRTLKIGKEAFYRQLDMPLVDAYAYASEVMVENMLDAEAEEGIGVHRQAPAQLAALSALRKRLPAPI